MLVAVALSKETLQLANGNAKNKGKKEQNKVTCYCETHITVNTRNIYGMLLCCEK